MSGGVAGRVPPRLRRVVKAAAATGVVLMYHRVGDRGPDPWGLAVTTERFAAHLEVIRRVARPVSLPELAVAAAQGRIPRRSVAVTFDDGYLDNLTVAAPLLDRHAVPATVFVTTGFVGSDVEPWWDLLEQLVLLPDVLPEWLPLRLPDGEVRIGPVAPAAADTAPSDDDDPASAPPGGRRWVYHEAWRRLRPLATAERDAALAALAAAVGVTPVRRESHRMLSGEQLGELAGREGIAIGGHTVTHPLLTALPAAGLREEVRDGRLRLEDMTGGPVRAFSYPFGGWSPAAVHEVHAAGFTCACTCDEVAVWRRTPRLTMGRFGVGDWDAPTFERRLGEWLRA